MAELTVAGLRIAYRTQGRGPPLVLLHGGLSDHRDWRTQFEGLTDDFTLVAWDAPGHGGSDDPPESWTTDDFSDCLAAFVEATCPEPAHVLGLSWGSGLALALYARRPELVRSLVLAAAYAGWAGSLPPEEVARRREASLRQSQQPAATVIEAWLPTLLTHRASPEVVAEVTEIMSGFHPAGFRALISSFSETDLRPVLPTIAVPTLLLYGEEDVRSPLDVARAMHAQIPGARLVVMPEVGHLSNMEAPAAFNAAVRAFLAEA